MAALQKGHFGKGHLEEKNKRGGYKRGKEEENVEDDQKATQAENNICCLQEN